MRVQGYLAHKFLNWRGEFRTTTHVGTVPQPLSLSERWKLRLGGRDLTFATPAITVHGHRVKTFRLIFDFPLGPLGFNSPNIALETTFDFPRNCLSREHSPCGLIRDNTIVGQ